MLWEMEFWVSMPTSMSACSASERAMCESRPAMTAVFVSLKLSLCMAFSRRASTWLMSRNPQEM